MEDDILRPDEKFSVYQFFEDGSYEEVRHLVSIEEAEKAAKHYCTSVAARIGITVRVIMTDQDDRTVFEWKYKEGIVFPKVHSVPMPVPPSESTPS